MFANRRYDVHKWEVERVFENWSAELVDWCGSMNARNTYDIRITCRAYARVQEERNSNGVMIYNERLYDVTIRICITSVTQNSSTPEPSLFPSILSDTPFPPLHLAATHASRGSVLSSNGINPLDGFNLFTNVSAYDFPTIFTRYWPVTIGGTVVYLYLNSLFHLWELKLCKRYRLFNCTVIYFANFWWFYKTWNKRLNNVIIMQMSFIWDEI